MKATLMAAGMTIILTCATLYGKKRYQQTFFPPFADLAVGTAVFALLFGLMTIASLIYDVVQ